MAELLRLNRPERRAELAPRGAEQHGRDLVRIADRIRVAHARAVAAEKEWVAATIQLAKSLAAARDRFRSNQEFGRWLSTEGIKISDSDRAALIKMGRNLPLTRTVLAQTESRSWQLICRNEIAPSGRLASANKTVYVEPQMWRDFTADLIDYFRPQFRPNDTFHDPCCGTNNGGFLPVLPPPRSYSEIQKGRDFLLWTKPVTWLFGNPDWDERVYREFAKHAFEVAENVVLLGPIGVLFTTLRNEDYRAAGHGLKEHFEVRWEDAFGEGGPQQGNALIIAHWRRGHPDALPLWR